MQLSSLEAVLACHRVTVGELECHQEFLTSAAHKDAGFIIERGTTACQLNSWMNASLSLKSLMCAMSEC
jgi:hypothetical protein